MVDGLSRGRQRRDQRCVQHPERLLGDPGLMRAAHWIVIAAAIAVAGCAKVVVVKVDGNKQPAEGVFYALPRTVIRVDVKIDRKEPKVADVPFMTFADIFAPGGKTACTDRDCADDGVKYELRDGVT